MTNFDSTVTVAGATETGRLASGCTALTDRGLRLLSTPTASSRRLGIALLKKARAGGDRLATCVLGMCALKGIGCGRDERSGVYLLEEAVSMGSLMAEDLLAEYEISRWEPLELAATDGLSGKALRAAKSENRKRAANRHVQALEAWRHLRSPLLRGSLSASLPAVREICGEIVRHDEVSDPLGLDVCLVLGTLGDAHATYLAALAYERGAGGVLSYDVAERLMRRAMRAGHHDALMWVRFARHSGRVV